MRIICARSKIVGRVLLMDIFVSGMITWISFIAIISWNAVIDVSIVLALILHSWSRILRFMVVWSMAELLCLTCTKTWLLMYFVLMLRRSNWRLILNVILTTSRANLSQISIYWPLELILLIIFTLFTILWPTISYMSWIITSLICNSWRSIRSLFMRWSPISCIFLIAIM